MSIAKNSTQKPTSDETKIWNIIEKLLAIHKSAMLKNAANILLSITNFILKSLLRQTIVAVP